MKKYLAAAVVAVMVFAFSAFAATLNVDGGTLQSGIDRDLTCAESADVTYDHHVDYHDQADDAWVESFTITFDSEDCIDKTLYFTVGSDAEFGDGEGLGAVVRLIDAQSVEIPVDPGDEDAWHDGVSIKDIESVSVTVFSDPPTREGEGGANTPDPIYGWATGIFENLSTK